MIVGLSIPASLKGPSVLRPADAAALCKEVADARQLAETARQRVSQLQEKLIQAKQKSSAHIDDFSNPDFSEARACFLPM